MRRQYLQPSKKYRAERFFVRGEPNETVTRERRRRRRNFFCLNHVVLTGRPRDDLRIDCLKLSEASSKARFRLVFFFTERRALSTRAPLCLKRPLLPWASLLTSVAQSNSASASAGAPARQPVWGLHSTERVGRSRRVLLIYGPNSFFFLGISRREPSRDRAATHRTRRLSSSYFASDAHSRRSFSTRYLLNGVVSTPPSEQRIANASSSRLTYKNIFRFLRSAFLR